MRPFAPILTCLPLITLLIALACTGTAFAQITGETVTIREPQQDDLYAAGRLVQLQAPADEDFVAAGETVSVTAGVGGDLTAAGREVTVAADVGDDVRVAGERVVVRGRVGGHVAAAGRTVTLAGDAEIVERAWLAGETVRVTGIVGGPLWAAGGRIEIAGTVNSDVTIEGGELILGEGARITGNLTVRADTEPTISEAAQVGGQVNYQPRERDDAAFGGTGLLMLLGLAVSAAILFLLWPRRMDGLAAAVGKAPWAHLGTGAAVLIGMPILIVLLFMTMIGGYLAVGLIALYAALILFGLVIGFLIAAFRGLDLVLRSHREGRLARLGALAAAVVVLWLVTLVPILGGLVMVALLLAGIGALTLAALHGRRAGDEGFATG